MPRFAKWVFLFVLAPAQFFLLAAGPADRPAPPATQPSATQATSTFKSPVFDDLDKFKRIAILCDGSGSMINLRASLNEQLSKGVASLSAEQSFNILFSRSLECESLGMELLPATAENRKKAGAFLKEISTNGACDPIPGLERAFRQKPDVIYLLTCGDFPDNAFVSRKIDELNVDKKVKVYPIAFVGPEDTDVEFIEVFKKIAADTNGKFRHVEAQKLNEPVFKSAVFDDLDQFRRIVFVSDSTHSMINKMALLKDQLNKAVNSLSAEQSFNVIVFKDKTSDSIAKEMLPATTGKKKKSDAFIEEMTTSESTDPIPGLEEAFREKPDVIYLLTDGDFPDNDFVSKTIAKLNKDNKTKLYTIAFLRQEDTDVEFIDFFKKLAAEANGKFRRVDVGKLDPPVFKSAVFDDLDKFHRIVFASDASGSMINKMATLKDQMNKAVSSLSDDQMFNMMFFEDTKVDSIAEKLTPATPANKKKAGTFLDGVTSTCTTDPLPTIDEAFREKPDVIYLLTDGDFPDNDAVLRKFRELNKDGKVKVYTISFTTASDTDTAYLDLLKTIARESGGKFKKVNEGNL